MDKENISLLEKDKIIILLCAKYKRCGVTESIETQNNIFKNFVMVRTFFWERQIFKLVKYIFCKNNKAQILLISHDLKSDILSSIFVFLSKIFGNKNRYRIKHMFFSHSEYWSDYLNRKGFIKGIFLSRLQSFIYFLNRSAILTPSETHLFALENFFKKKRRNFKVLPHTINKDIFFKVTKKYIHKKVNNEEFKKLKIIISDSYDKLKNLDYSIKVANIVSKKIPSEIIILGNYPLEVKRKLQKESKVKIKFIFSDNLNDLLDIYSNSNLYISFSESESFHLSIFYAFILGLDILCSNIPAHKYLYRFFPNRNIYMYSDKDINQFIKSKYFKDLEIRNMNNNIQTINFERYSDYVFSKYKSLLSDLRFI